MESRRRWERRPAVLAVLLAAVLAVSGCGGASGGAASGSGTGSSSSGSSDGAGGSGGGSTGSGGEGSGSAPEQPLQPLKVGIVTCADMCGWELMAQEQGYLEEAGLQVEYIEADSSSTLIRSLLAGDLDMIEIAPPEAFIARANGGTVKVIGASVSGTAFSLLAKESIKSVRDLEGATMGTSQLGASPYMMVLGLMQKAGGDFDKINWLVSGGNADRMKALLAGQLDAAPVPSAFESQLASNPGFHVLARIGEDLPEYIRVAIVANERSLAQKEEEFRRYFVAYSKGLRKAVEDKDAFVELSLKATNGGEDQRATFESVWNMHIDQRLISPDLSISPDYLQFNQDLTVQVGKQEKEIPIGEIYDDRFVQAVADELGAWSW